MDIPDAERCARELIGLFAQYGLPDNGLSDSLDEYSHFFVTVPVIGSFNTGKSSLINAVLGMPLLPVGITAETKVPTEILWGSPAVTVTRGGSLQRVGLWELRSKRLDMSGVTLLHAECELPFLHQIHQVMIVDTPGLDGGSPEQEKALRSYLPNSLAYILVFSADKPVVSESAAVFLSELQLRDIPVVAVITKSDKVTADELLQSERFLRKTISSTLGLGGIDLVSVSSRGDVSPVRELLSRLQERADVMARERLCRAVCAACRQLTSYLTVRRSGAVMPVSEFEGSSAALSARIALMREMISDELERFAVQLAESREKLLRRLSDSLCDAAQPIEDIILSGQRAEDYTDRMLTSTISTGLSEECTPLFAGCVRKISAFMKLDDLTGEAGRRRPSPEDFPMLDPRRVATLGWETHELPNPADEAAASFGGSRKIFDEFLPSSVFSMGAARKQSDARQAEVHTAVNGHILPELYKAAEACISGGLSGSTEKVYEMINGALDKEYSLQQKAIDDIAQGRQSAEESRQACIRQLDGDMASVAGIYDSCSHCDITAGEAL